MRSITNRLALVAVLTGSLAVAQLGLPPGLVLANQFHLWNLGIVPAPSAMQFSPDGSTLYISGAGNQPGSLLYSAPVIRDVTGRIVGFQAATLVAVVSYIDAGLEVGPNGVIFFTTYPTNQLGEIVNGVVYEFPLPAAVGTSGGMTFVPSSQPNAGTMLVSSFSNGGIYAVTLTANPNGTFTPSSASLFAQMPSSAIEALQYVPSGPFEGDLLVADFTWPGAVLRRIDIDPSSGQPFGGASTPQLHDLITNFPMQVGMAFDPITRDLFITDWLTFSLFQIRGFNTLLPLVANASTVSASGGSVFFSLRAGTANQFKNYILAASASGSVPGTPIGSLTLPLNIDAVTQLSVELADSAFFPNSYSFFSDIGDSNAVLLVPPGFIPSVAIGATIQFAYLTIAPEDFVSNAWSVTIVP